LLSWGGHPDGCTRYYELILDAQEWQIARAAAEQRSLLGNVGHLATITSAAENDMVTELLMMAGLTIGEDVWLGGYQDDICLVDTGWFWVTGEPWSFTGWSPTNPSNGTFIDCENVVETSSAGQWNDRYETDLRTNVGYVVEYAVCGDCNLNAQDDLILWGNMSIRDSSKIIDLSGNGHDLVIHGTPSFEGSAVVFNQDGYLRVDDSDALDLLQDWTISFWLRIDDAAFNSLWALKARAFGGDEGGWGVGSDVNLAIYKAVLDNFDFQSQNAVPAENWTLVTITFEETIGRVRIYLDGILDRETTVDDDGEGPIEVMANTYPLIIGGQVLQDGITVQQHARGAMADFRIFGREIAPCEVATLHTHTSCDTDSNGVPDALENPWIRNPATGSVYKLTRYGSWEEAQAEALAAGGNLVMIDDAFEDHWLWEHFASSATEDLWIGLYQVPGSPEPGDGWVWVSGIPVAYVGWYGQEPNDLNGQQDWAVIEPIAVPGSDPPTPQWDDREEAYLRGIMEAYDCNADGIPDQCNLSCGQGCQECDLSGCGQSIDCNSNGLPDECEPDFDSDGQINDCDDDIDDDGVPNELDACGYTPPGASIIDDPSSCLYGTLRGDYDGDCDVDLQDFAEFTREMTVPQAAQRVLR
jgi:hypothetical protein